VREIRPVVEKALTLPHSKAVGEWLLEKLSGTLPEGMLCL
jgi:hypothetical protein